MSGLRGRRVPVLAVVLVAVALAAGLVALASARYAGPSSAAPPSHAGEAGRAGATDRDRAGGRSTPATTATTTPATSTATSTPSAPPLGIYAGPGALTAVDAVDHQLGGRVGDAFDFLPYGTWTTLTDPSWLADDWRGSSFDLILGVPMLPTAGGTLAEGAAGQFDAQFTVLAQRLVADGLGGSTLLVGWQPDDPGTPWSVGSTAAAADYVAFWDRIESTMAAAPGAHFVFEWDAGDTRTSPIRPTETYPGDTAVGIVATDAFDTGYRTLPVTAQWTAVLEQPYGPGWTAKFAATHHTPMALAMWGAVPVAAGGGGDNPTFAIQLLRWAAAAHLVDCVLWDYGDWATMSGDFPATAAAVRLWFAPSVG
ncbi:MAG TPA: hypothetical protein VGG23_08795 [Acidimicrobiales bacterium]